MANCTECGKRHGFVALIYEGGLCSLCFRKQKDAIQAHREQLASTIKLEGETVESELNGSIENPWGISEAQTLPSEKDDLDVRNAKINSIMITTEATIDLNIIKRIDIVAATAFCPADMDVAGFKDDLFFNLKKSAMKVGANAIIGINVSIVQSLSAQFGTASLNRHLAVAMGTAVVVEEKLK